MGGLLVLFLSILHLPSFAANLGDVVINEIMYNPSGSDGDHEWVEIHNKSTSSIDLTGWKFFEDGTNHGLTFTQGGSTVPAGGFAILADSAAAVIADYAANTAVTGGIVIDTVFSLSNTGEVLALIDNASVVISTLTYADAAPWPTEAEGKSIERVAATGSDNDPANWALGPSSGTPNAQNAAVGGGGGGATESNCSNGVDDDGDGQTDCSDSDCAAAAACQTTAGSTSTVKVLEVDDTYNPFSPVDRDPAYRTGRINFNVYSGGFIKTIRVANVRGETIRILINNDLGSAGAVYSGAAAGTVTWDGRDDNGDVVPMGIYVVFMEAVDPTTGDRVTGRDTIVMGRPF